MMEGLNQSKKLSAFNGIHDKFWGIARTLLNQKPAYLHFDWIISYYYRRWRWFTYLSVLTFCAQILLARLLGVKLVWTLHNILPHDRPDVPIHRFCQRFLARRCEWVRVFTHSSVERAAEELRIPVEKIKVVPEGAYTQVYPNQVTQEEARTYLEIPPHAKVLLYIGLIKPYKGVLELVQTFNRLDQDNAYLCIAGKIMDAPYGARIKQELNPRVLLTDHFIPGNELQYYFNAANVVVLPFQKIENSGSVILAMGFSKPIIAPAVGVLKERLNAQSDWLYGSSLEMEAALKKALHTVPEELKEIGIANFKTLSAHRWEDFANAFS
jgi:glycosyltransferase involved in cell wall biosynthesis